MTRIAKLHEAIVSGNRDAATAQTRSALEAGTDPQSLIDDSMIPAMAEVGRRFEQEEYFVPELLLSARAMKTALELIRPLLVGKGAPKKGRIVIGTVKGDLHDIGKNLVSAMLEGAGFEVVDLGSDVSPEKFVAAVEENDAELVALSALLTVTMPSMTSTISAFEEAGLRDRVKILVGGAPLSTEYAVEIRADAYANNANTAVRAAEKLLRA